MISNKSAEFYRVKDISKSNTAWRCHKTKAPTFHTVRVYDCMYIGVGTGVGVGGGAEYLFAKLDITITLIILFFVLVKISEKSNNPPPPPPAFSLLSTPLWLFKKKIIFQNVSQHKQDIWKKINKLVHSSILFLYQPLILKKNRIDCF